MLDIPSWKLTYPTLGKGKSSSKYHFFGGYVSSLEGIYNYIYIHIFTYIWLLFFMIHVGQPILETHLKFLTWNLNMIELEHLQFWCVDPWYLTWGVYGGNIPKKWVPGWVGERFNPLDKMMLFCHNRIISPGSLGVKINKCFKKPSRTLFEAITIIINRCQSQLVGGFNPIEKY